MGACFRCWSIFLASALLAALPSAPARSKASDNTRHSRGRSPSIREAAEAAGIPTALRTVRPAPPPPPQHRPPRGNGRGGGGSGDSSSSTDAAARNLLGYGMIGLIGAILVCVHNGMTRELGSDVRRVVWIRPPSSVAAVAASREDAVAFSPALLSYGSADGAPEAPEDTGG